MPQVSTLATSATLAGVPRTFLIDTDTASDDECNSHAREAYKIQTGEDGICLPDPVAMCLALDPTIGTSWSEHYVEVETESELTRGMTIVDRLNVAEDERNRATWSALINGKHKANCWTIDNRRWKDALYATLR